MYVCVCYGRHLPDVEVTLESMLKPRVATLPGHIQSVYVQNICKLYGRVLAKAEQSDDDELVQRASELVSQHLALFVHSADLEVQERVSITVCLSVCLSLCLSVCVYVCLSVFLSVCLYFCLSRTKSQRARLSTPRVVCTQR